MGILITGRTWIHTGKKEKDYGIKGFIEREKKSGK